MTARAGTFVTRVAWNGALSAVAAGVVVALVTVWIGDSSFRTNEDSLLGDAAETFALELRAHGADPIALAADEARELEHALISVAVFEEQRLSPVIQNYRRSHRTCAEITARYACARGAPKR